MSKRSLKISILLFAMAFIVGAAFAATNGVLTFGGTVRINNAGTTPPPEMGIEFVNVANPTVNPIIQNYLNATASIVLTEDGTQTLNFDINIDDLSRIPTGGASLARINFTIANTGNVPVRLQQITNNSADRLSAIPFQVMLDQHGTVFGTAFLNNPRHIGRVLQPGQTLGGFINLCPVCLNNHLNRYTVRDTQRVLSFSVGLAYEAVGTTILEVNEIFEYIAPVYCEEI